MIEPKISYSKILSNLIKEDYFQFKNGDSIEHLPVSNMLTFKGKDSLTSGQYFTLTGVNEAALSVIIKIMYE